MDNMWKDFEVWVDKRDKTYEKVEISVRKHALQFAHEVANRADVRKVTVVGHSGSILILDNDYPRK